MPRLLPAAIAWGMLFATTLVPPAVAHPGAHDHLSWSGVVEHLGTAWHVWPLAAAVAAGLLVLRIGQRRQALTKAAASNTKDRT